MYNLKQLGSGFEGTVYELNDNTAIKIFHKGVSFTYLKTNNLLIKNNSTYLFPDRIFNTSNLSGYTMKKISKPQLKNIDINKESLSTLSYACEILEKDTVLISSEHYVFNDLSDSNIMFDKTFTILDALGKNSIIKKEDCYTQNIRNFCSLLMQKLFNNDPQLLKMLYSNKNIKQAYYEGIPYKCPSLFFLLLMEEFGEDMSVKDLKNKIKSK